jgi:hypothetical protein
MCIVFASASENQLSLNFLEGCFVAIAVATSLAWPRIGSRGFGYIERLFRQLASRPNVSVAAVGLTFLVLRLGILPLHPIPFPFVTDDFSNLLAADTFIHGRLTNPTPAMWVHFESIHIDMKPTYMSMYFPGEGLILAGGKFLFGNPWFGILLAGGLMCATLCWALQAWLPRSWALLGGFLAVLRIGLFSYWTGTYQAPGALAAFGGALVLGAFPRFKRSPNGRNAILMVLGALVLALTRPYEGLLLSATVVIALVWWFRSQSRWPGALKMLRMVLPALVLLLAGLAWMGYYDFRVFGSPSTLPYAVNRATYAVAPYYVWQKPRPEPAYRHEEMRRFYQVDELDDYYRVTSRPGLAVMTFVKAIRGMIFFSGVALLPPLLMLPWTLLDRRIRFLVVSLIVLAAGMVVEIYLFPHYLAPFTTAFYAVGLQCMRHLRVWQPGGKPVGEAMTRRIVAICIVMAGVRLFDQQLHCPVPARPMGTWILSWFGPDHFVPERSVVERQFEQLPGDQLAIVRYSPTHDPIDEWVYNSADIDGSKVIWARDMNPNANSELIQYYGNRRVWLVQPDREPMVSPYPVPEEVTAAVP